MQTDKPCEIGNRDSTPYRSDKQIHQKKLNVNQWRNTPALTSKSSSSFINFDIVDFYISTSKGILLKAINFTKSVIPTQDNFIKTTLHSRKALLFNKKSVRVRKDKPDFDVTIGSYDGAEVCELVGFYILGILTKEFGHDKIGLYRDDGLGCFQNLSGPESEKVKKKFGKMFKEGGLSITVEYNLQIADILDVTFDLRTDKYYPYRKDNSALINSQTTHQLLPNKYHRWSAEEFLIYLVIKNTSTKLYPHIMMHLKLVASMKS